MNLLRNVCDKELLDRTKSLVKAELKLTTEVLHHLKEIQNRRLFAARGYSSLFEYCVKELGYCESAAYQRISTMRLIAEVPEVEEKLKEGALTLSAISQAQTFFRKEIKDKKNYSPARKREVLKKLENKTKRETTEILVELSPASHLPADRERPLTSEKTEIRFAASNELMAKLKRIREMESHSLKSLDYEELLSWMADFVLQKRYRVKRNRGAELAGAIKSNAKLRVRKSESVQASSTSRYISASLRQELWFRDKGQCSYRDPLTGKKCKSTHRIQVEHIQPLALGGRTELENLRLLCATHNQYMAIKSFGRKKMGEHVSLGG